jgi:hypothetical protein
MGEMRKLVKILEEGFTPVFASAGTVLQDMRVFDPVPQTAGDQYQPWAYEYLSRSGKDHESIFARYDPPVSGPKPAPNPRYFHSGGHGKRFITKGGRQARWSKR